MKKITNTLKAIWKDESAQGMAEYVLLLFAVASIAFIFKDKIIGIVKGRMGTLETELGGFDVQKN